MHGPPRIMKAPKVAIGVAHALGTSPYLTGDAFTVADACLFTIVNSHHFLKFDIGRGPALQRFQERVSARPHVKKTLDDEHLLKAA